MAEESKTEIKKDELPDLETVIAKAKRAFALKHYEEAADLYSIACENYATLCTPATVDIYYLYGCALLEYAIASNNVLGNKPGAGGDEGPEEPEPKVKNEAKGLFFFGADGEEDPALDLFEQADAAVKAEEEAEKKENEEADEEEPDDFENAWDMLQLARNTYETMQGDDSQLKLAATYMALGDISLETEKFEDAIGDYKSALEIKIKLLPLENRQIADAHFRLSLAYDLGAGNVANQLEHAQGALDSVKKRLKVLQELLPKAPENKATAPETDAKGKGKGKAVSVQENPLGWTPKFESLETLTKPEIEAEIKDVTSLAEELEAKLEDIRSQPVDAGTGGTSVAGNTMARVEKELDKELGTSGFGSAINPNAPVNDLTSMVKKKKPKPEASVNPLVPDASINPLVPDAASLPSLGKRKAEEPDIDREEKKQRTE